MAIPFRLNNPPALFFGKFIFSDDRKIYIGEFGNKFLSRTLQGHAMGATGVTGKNNEVFQSMGMKRMDNIFHQSLQSCSSYGDRSRMT